MPRFSRLTLAVAAVALPTLFAAHASAQVRVQILHASDLEGGVEAVDDAPNFAAVVQALEDRAAQGGIPSLLLSAGDNYIPGPFFSAAGDLSVRGVLRSVLGNPSARELEGRVDIAIMNVLGLDATAVGNHEFDAGTRAVRDLIGTDIRPNDPRWLGTQFPYLSANLDFSADANLARLYTSQILPTTAFESPLNNLPVAAAAPKLAPAAIVVRGNERFGIVGATTPLVESISSTGDVRVRNPGAGTNDMAALAQVLQPTIDALTSAGVDKVVLVTHLQQIALEQQLVGLLRDVDVVIAGGSDTLLADGTDRLRAGDTAQGPYPVVTTNANGQPALIVSTDGQYTYVGRLVVDFDRNGVILPQSVVAAESGAFAADAPGVAALWTDPNAAFAPGTKGGAVTALTDAVRLVVLQKDGNVLGSASVFLEGRRTPVRTEETNLGNLTADANLEIARQLDPTVLVSLKNGGGIRNPIGSIDGITGALLPTAGNPLSGKLPGQISQLDVEDSLRFNNGLSLLTLTRPQLKQVLEHAVSAWTPTATPGQFAQVGGISLSFDPSRAAGDRVRYAALTTPGAASPVLVADGRIIGVAPVRIVTLDFLAGGGDSYPYPAFVAADPVFADRVDMRSAGLPPGASVFAPAGTEQDAMAEFLITNHAASPFGVADTSRALDQRIQNLAARGEGVLAFVDPPFQINVAQDIARCGPISIDVVGAFPNTRVFNLLSVGCSNGRGPLFGVGADAFAQIFLPLGAAPFHVLVDGDGVFQWTAQTGCSMQIPVEAVSIEMIDGPAWSFINRISAPICTTISL